MASAKIAVENVEKAMIIRLKAERVEKNLIRDAYAAGATAVDIRGARVRALEHQIKVMRQEMEMIDTVRERLGLDGD